MLAEIEDFIEGFNQPTYRGMRISRMALAAWSTSIIMARWKWAMAPATASMRSSCVSASNSRLSV
jgi:hypothetical protein